MGDRWKSIMLKILILCFLFFYLEAEAMEKKLVVITGVSRGVGYELTKEFAQQGWKIAGCGRSSKDIQKLQKEQGPEHFFSVVDITDDVSVAHWVDEVTAKMGFPSLLINNAGVINQPQVLWEISAAEFFEVINVNVIGTTNVLRHWIPLMAKQGQGVLVNVSSDWGIYGAGHFAPYCASKFAIEGLTQSLAQELPKGLTVVALDPGTINTDMLKKAFPTGAHSYPTAEQQAKILVPTLLKITPKDNGKHLTAY